jgi:hypothetical protein
MMTVTALVVQLFLLYRYVTDICLARELDIDEPTHDCSSVFILTRQYLIYIPLVAIAVGSFVGGMIVGIKVWLADT